MPEAITPWLVLGTTFLAFLAALGAAWMWLWKKAFWPAFQGGVMDAVTPLQEALDRLADAIERTDKSVEEKLATRGVEVDAKFSNLSNRLQALEVRQARDTQKVIETVQETAAAALPPPSDEK